MAMVLKVTKADDTCCPVKSAKFIAREQWLAAGDGNGWVHVYAYATQAKVVEFEAHGANPVSSLAVQPTDSFLLTSSSVALTSTKLWYWGQGWRCTREFDQNSGGVSHLTFNPRDDTTFASISTDGDVKVWDTRISHPITTLQEKSTGRACSFYTDDASNRHFLLISRADQSCASAMIRDFQTQQVVHQLSVMGQRVFDDIACHPTLPIVATVTSDQGLLYFWNTRTYRVEKIVGLNERPIRGMMFTGTDLARLIVPCSKGVWIVELADEFAALATDLSTMVVGAD